MKEQAIIHASRQKHAPNTLAKYEGRSLRAHLEDPTLFKAFEHLEADETAVAFLELYQYALDGKLKNFETFTQICAVIQDKIRRDTSENLNAKYGIRYPAEYLNFMVLMRSYGGNSAHQYGLLTGQIPGPCSRHLR